MDLRKKKILGGLAGIAAGIAIVALGLKTSFLQDIENRSWDWREKLVPAVPVADPNIKIIRIDQASIDSFLAEEKYSWPWPREYYSAVIAFLQRAGARALAFDMLFTEPSSYGPADDHALGQALAQNFPVVSAAVPSDRFIENELYRKEKNSADVPDAAALQPGLTPFRALMLPTEDILQSSQLIGSVQAQPDSDGIFRRAPLGALVQGRAILSLPFALFLAGKGPVASVVDRRLDKARVLRFPASPQAYGIYSIADIIRSFDRILHDEKPLVEPAEFKNAWVILGISAPGLSDIRPTPVDETAPGYFFHAATLDNILHDRFAILMSRRAAVAWSAVFIIAGTAAVLALSTALLQVVALSTLLLLLVLLYYYCCLHGIWAPLVIPLLGIGGSLSMAQLCRYYLEGGEQRFLRDAFQRYVSPDVIAELVKDPTKLGIGGERRDLTMTFFDIEGFSQVAEKLEASRLAALLNLFLTEMTKIILLHRGTVDKFVGDGIVAFWNAPLRNPEHAVTAVQAVRQCQERLQALQPQFEKEFLLNIRMRAGVHSGEVSVGNFGSSDRFSYTILGDAANFASRLEGVNKVFGTAIAVSKATRDLCGDRVAFRRLGCVQVVGRSEINEIYEPLEAGKEYQLATYEKAISAFEAGDLKSARIYFEMLENDPVARAYLRRIASLSDLASSAVWILTEK